MIEAARQSGASDELLASLGAMEILVPVVETESFARPKGYSTRDQFDIEVTDILLLARAVVSGSIQREVLQANTKLIAPWPGPPTEISRFLESGLPRS